MHKGPHNQLEQMLKTQVKDWYYSPVVKAQRRRSGAFEAMGAFAAAKVRSGSNDTCNVLLAFTGKMLQPIIIRHQLPALKPKQPNIHFA